MTETEDTPHRPVKTCVYCPNPILDGLFCLACGVAVVEAEAHHAHDVYTLRHRDPSCSILPMDATKTTAAAISAALRKAGFNPVSPANSREGLKVRETYQGIRVTADLDSPAASHLLAGDARAALADLGYEVEEIPVRTETAAFRVVRPAPATVQYPANVCEDHEYGSNWPCLGCGK